PPLGYSTRCLKCRPCGSKSVNHKRYQPHSTRLSGWNGPAH
ncbi:uncharacterized protein METZ01_LOCUS226045, partial [marine metagenome]